MYIAFPTDLFQKKVEGARFKTSIKLSIPSNELEKQDYMVDIVLKYLYAVKDSVILVNVCTIRHRVMQRVHDLVAVSRLPTFVVPMGKGAVNKTHPNYGGVYAGDTFNEAGREWVESSGLIFNSKAIISDFNTAGFTY